MFRAFTLSRVAQSRWQTPLVGMVPLGRFSSTKAAPPPAGDDWDFDDDDFLFLDEMFEGKIESPEWIPESERRLLERENVDSKK